MPITLIYYVIVTRLLSAGFPCTKCNYQLHYQEVTADLLSRVETLSRDLDTVKSSDKMEEMLADIQGVREQLDSHVTRSDQQIKDVYLAFNVTQDQV